MPRAPVVPSYRLHRATGQAVVTLSGRDHYLGRHDSPESHARYNALVAEWLAGGRHAQPRAPDLTVSEVLAAYWAHAQAYYVKAGKPTSQQDTVRRSLAPARELYGATPARDFGPARLAAVRERMVASGWCRTLVNQRTDCVKRAFKWAVAQELVPPSAYEGLRCLDGLRRGRSPAPEAPPVLPAPEAAIALVLPRLPGPLRDAAELQLLTAARPGEVLALRPCDLQRAGAVWLYRPGGHKTEHHGRPRLVLIGPRGQEVLLRRLARRCPRCGAVGREGALGWRGDLCGPCGDWTVEQGVAGPWPPRWPAEGQDAYLFSPREAQAERRAAQRAARRTPVQPSQRCRRKASPKKAPGERYAGRSYSHAVWGACERAGCEHWHPHQLRHNAATRLRAEFGLEVARVILGHSSASMAELYAQEHLAPAIEAMRLRG